MLSEAKVQSDIKTTTPNIGGKINGNTKHLTLSGGISTGSGAGGRMIHSDTTENWNHQLDLIAKKDHIYVYTDYSQDSEGNNLAGIKIGDGLAYLIDLPFAVGNIDPLNDHINDTVIHITDEEREFWNNKVTCFLSQGDDNVVVFTKE